MWKFSVTAHGKGVVDGVGGQVKLLVHKKGISLGKNLNIIKDAESFFKLAKQLNQQTAVIHVPTEEVGKYKDTNPFAESLPVNSIFKMHAMCSYYNDAEPASISLPK